MFRYAAGKGHRRVQRHRIRPVTGAHPVIVRRIRQLIFPAAKRGQHYLDLRRTCAARIHHIGRRHLPDNGIHGVKKYPAAILYRRKTAKLHAVGVRMVARIFPNDDILLDAAIQCLQLQVRRLVKQPPIDHAGICPVSIARRPAIYGYWRPVFLLLLFRVGLCGGRRCAGRWTRSGFRRTVRKRSEGQGWRGAKICSGKKRGLWRCGRLWRWVRLCRCCRRRAVRNRRFSFRRRPLVPRLFPNGSTAAGKAQAGNFRVLSSCQSHRLCFRISNGVASCFFRPLLRRRCLCCRLLFRLYFFLLLRFLRGFRLRLRSRFRGDCWFLGDRCFGGDCCFRCCRRLRLLPLDQNIGDHIGIVVLRIVRVPGQRLLHRRAENKGACVPLRLHLPCPVLVAVASLPFLPAVHAQKVLLRFPLQAHRQPLGQIQRFQGRSRRHLPPLQRLRSFISHKRLNRSARDFPRRLCRHNVALRRRILPFLCCFLFRHHRIKRNACSVHTHGNKRFIFFKALLDFYPCGRLLADQPRPCVQQPSRLFQHHLCFGIWLYDHRLAAVFVVIDCDARLRLLRVRVTPRSLRQSRQRQSCKRKDSG